MLGPILLLALIAPQTNGSKEPRELLAELIESTNELEHFHAEYESDRDGSKGRLTLDYQAPGSIRIGGSSPKGRLDSGCVDSVLWIDHEQPDGSKTWARVDMLGRGGDLEIPLSLLRREFWRPEGGPDVFVELFWRLNAETNRLEPSVSIQQRFIGDDGHFALLGWLHSLLHVKEPLTFEDGDLVYRHEGVSCRVNLETGILEELILISADGSRLELELVKLDLDHGLTAEEFEAPEPHPEARDASEELRLPWQSGYQLRLLSLKHVHGTLRTGARRLDGDVRYEVESLLAALSEPWIHSGYDSWVLETEKNSKAFAEWLRSSKDSGSPPEDLETAVAERRGILVEILQRAEDKFVSGIPGDPDDLADSTSWRELRAVENETVAKLFDRLVSQLVLQTFDEAVDEVLDK